MLAKFVVVLDLDSLALQDPERSHLRDMALTNLQAALKRAEESGALSDHHAPNSPSFTVCDCQHYDDDPLSTYWRCPKCKEVDRCPAYELADVGTPHCINCGDGTEMEKSSHNEYNKHLNSDREKD